jgi:hypothetical protein
METQTGGVDHEPEASRMPGSMPPLNACARCPGIVERASWASCAECQAILPSLYHQPIPGPLDGRRLSKGRTLHDARFKDCVRSEPSHCGAWLVFHPAHRLPSVAFECWVEVSLWTADTGQIV